MRRLLLPLILVTALSSLADDSIIRQLIQVNAEWKNQSDGQQMAASSDVNNNKTFDDWIATHLMLVEQTLRHRATNQLTPSQLQNRFMLLDELNSYWHSRAFPVNDYLSYKNPIFIDRNGNHCAVGFLMKQSGASSLANAIDGSQKFAYIKEIKTEGVNDWANSNGFTIEELAWIQPGYPVSFTVDDLSGGLNGTVNCMLTGNSSPSIYAGGSFTSSTKGAPCNGIAMYISGIAGWDWIGLGDGVNGTVNALLMHNNKLYVGGEFTMAGLIPASNIAVYDLGTSQWEALGSLDSKVNSLTVFNNEIYAGGEFTGFVSKWMGSQWLDVTSGFLYGEGVRTLEVWNNTLMIGGKFELATGAIRKNVATYDGIYMGTSGFGTTTPVNDFELFRDTLYAACHFVEGTDTCSLARFVNFDWEVVLKPFQEPMSSFDGTTINHLMAADNQLFCAGSFSVAEGMYYGSNLMKFERDINSQPVCIPMLMLNGGLNTIAALGNTICFGGEFTLAGSDTLNNIGQFSNSLLNVSGPGEELSAAIAVFPNPAINIINIRLENFSTDMDYMIKILDINGREVYTQKIIRQLTSIDLSKNAGGIYFVQVNDREGNVLGKEKIVIR